MRVTELVLDFLGRTIGFRGRVKLYHSTSLAVLAEIQREGLKPHAGGVGLNKHRVGVYLWRHREQAMIWARGGIVLTVDLPAEMTRLLQPDDEFFEDESEAWIFPGTIPPVLIVEVIRVAVLA
jgi:hypothetical protein